MLKVYICEDEKRQLTRLKSMVEKVILIESYDMEVGLATENPHDIVKDIENSKFTGIYFLDINLESDMDGFALSKIIRKHDPRGFIIFITSNSDMSQLTFNYKSEAMDFIIKDNATNTGLRIAECIKEANLRFSINNAPKNKVFGFKFGDMVTYEEFENIILFETNPNDNHKIYLYAINRAVDIRSTLREASRNLDERFMRCSGSCIVNTDMIENISKRTRKITMKTGQTAEASVRCIRTIINRILSGNCDNIIIT